MRVAGTVGKLMVKAVDCDPVDGAALQGHSSADGDEILQPFGGDITAMREQSVVAHGDAEILREGPHEGKDDQRGPAEDEERRYRCEVEDRQDAAKYPVKAAVAALDQAGEINRLLG